MDNYQYCARWAERQVGGHAGNVLDYGCGSGKVVALLRNRGIAAYGCDTYGECPEAWDQVPAEVAPYVTRMDSWRIPFEDSSFDCVLSNQVIEHVAQLDALLLELARVLKPNGVSLHLFPHRGVWVEGHANIPFLHWFPRGSRTRVSYAVLMSRVGFGLPLYGKTRKERYTNKCQWLDKWTHYRTRGELMAHFRQRFAVEYVEPDLFDARTGRTLPLPRVAKTWATRKLAGCAVVLRPLAHTMPVHAPADLM